jgi:hypothetical protein
VAVARGRIGGKLRDIRREFTREWAAQSVDDDTTGKVATIPARQVTCAGRTNKETGAGGAGF